MSKLPYREFTSGSIVKLTGNYLISTGQRTGGEGLKRWVAQFCSCPLCKTGRFIAVDEPSTTEWTKEELESEPGIKYRHLNKETISIVGQIDHRNCGDVYVGITIEGLIKGHMKEGGKVETKQKEKIIKSKSAADKSISDNSLNLDLLK